MMEKKSCENIVCSRCSNPAVEGSSPPLCSNCNVLSKEGCDKTPTLRDIDSMEDLFKE